MNAISKRRLSELAPEFSQVATDVCEEAEKALEPLGYTLLVTQTVRTIAEQNILYAKGRTAPGAIVTNAKGGQSPHNFGLAFDFVLLKDNKPMWNEPRDHWAIVGEIAKAKGLTWGGDFKTIVDLPHIEATDWKLRQAAWKAGAIEVA